MATKSTPKLLRVLKSDSAGFAAEWRVLCRRSTLDSGVDADVLEIVERVRDGGDSALLDCVEQYDGFRPKRLELTNDEWDAGCEAVDPANRAAIGKASMRIRDFHRKRIPSSWEMREEGGGYMGQRIRPLSRVGIHVPYENVVHPSAVIMNATPASVVEVPDIVLAASPRADGTVAPELLMAARVAGVHRVLKMGGAHAIAAFAFGTESLARVDKIIGPGNPTVDAAKRLVQDVVGVDGPAGAREVCIVADKSATPAWLAADLLSQAEHDESACTLLITHYRSLASRVEEQLAKQLKPLGKARATKKALSSGGAIVLTKSLDESLALANEYAPEHVVLAVDAPELASKSVHNAGAIFLGHYTPVAVGDYLAGPNHMLPTGGRSRFYSPLGVEDFLKRTSFVKFEPPKLRELGAEVIRLAEVEGLKGHGASVDLRLQKIRRARREREAAREAEL
jgi:histidinol dehydrogenase